MALLTRQALEKALDEFWESTPATTGLSLCSRRSQFACLPSYLDIGTAREISYVWAALSDACHYHAYEVAPNAVELTGWINAVAGLMGCMRDKLADSLARTHSEGGQLSKRSKLVTLRDRAVVRARVLLCGVPPCCWSLKGER